MAVTLKSVPVEAVKKLVTAARKPRTKKPAPAPVPVCNVCFKKLNWRDAAYCGGQKAIMCKTCHQKAERRRLRGVYVSPKNMPHAPMAYGTERTAKLTARPAWKAGKPKAAPQPVQKATRQERAAKRTEKYLRRKAARQARKERAA